MTSPNKIDVQRELQQAKDFISNPTPFAQSLVIQLKTGKMGRLRHNALQRHFFSNYSIGTRRIDILLKYRQAGATTGIIGEITRILWTRSLRALTLMDRGEHTKNIREVAARMFDNWPNALNVGSMAFHKPARIIDNGSTVRFSNESRWSIDTAGAKTVARSTTVDILQLSELGHYQYDKEVVAAAQQAAEKAYWKIWDSTPNGAKGVLYEGAMQALDGDKAYKLHFYPWWIDDYSIPLDPDDVWKPLDGEEQELVRLHQLTLEQINWRRAKKRELGRLFEQEYPEDVLTCFLRSGQGYFGDISHVFTAPAGTEPNGDIHLAGLDFGQQQDMTALVVINPATRMMVDSLRLNKLPWADIRSRVLAMLKKWNVALVHAERNSMGNSEIERLRIEAGEQGIRAGIWGFDMTGSSKPPVMADLYTALHENGLRLIDDPVVRHELYAAAAKQTMRGWTVESPRDETGHGDTVVALALAWHSYIKYAGRPRDVNP